MPATRRAPHSPPNADEQSDAERDRRSRALEEPLEVAWKQTDPYGIALVRNPLHGTKYRVYLPAFPQLEGALCTCQDFARRGLSTCKHLEAIRLSLADGPAPALPRPSGREQAAAVWATIDRSRARRAGQPASLQALRIEGRALIDRPAGAEPPARERASPRTK